MPHSFIFFRILAQRTGHDADPHRNSEPAARPKRFSSRRGIGGAVLRGGCLLGLCLGGVGCGPELDEAELGHIEYRLPEVPGADEPYPLPDLTPLEDPEPAPEKTDS